MAGGVGEDAAVERPALEVLAGLGWETVSGFDEVLGVAGTLGRDRDSQAVLVHRLRACLEGLNPDVSGAGLDRAVEELTVTRSAMDPVRANREVWDLLRDGFPVEVDVEGGGRETKRVRFVDWNDPSRNEYLAVSQLWLQGPLYRRRPDIVLFVNGVPLVLMEFKAPHVNVRAAFDENLRDYRTAVPQLFTFNGFVLVSNGADSKVGSTFAPWGHFADWKKINSEGEEGIVSLETALRGTCEPARMLDLVDNFVAFTEAPGGLVKAVAKNHQYLGVNSALEAVDGLDDRDGKLGVFWHTQGSGKSLSMLWFTQKVLRKRPGNWTFVMVTDRKELDDQLYETFADSGAITSGVNVHAETSAHLREFRRSPVRVHADPKVHTGGPHGGDAGAVGTRRHHRDHRRGAPVPVRHAGDEHAEGAPERFVPRVHRHPAHGRRGTHPAGLRRIRVGVQLPGLDPGRCHRPVVLREPDPELQLVNDDFDDDLEKLLEEAELDDDQERAVSASSLASTTWSRGPSGSKRSLTISSITS